MAKATVEEDHQLALIETDHPQRAKILKLVKTIKGADTDRSEAQERSTKARDDLAALMRELKLPECRIGEFAIKLRPGRDKVSVRKADDEQEEGE